MRAIHRVQDFDGHVEVHIYAQPLYWQAPGAGPSLVIVATENDLVYGLDAETGHAVWLTALGQPARRLVRIRLNGPHSLTIAISYGPPRVCAVRTPFSSSLSRPSTIAAAEAPVTPCRPFGSLRDRCPAARDALYRARDFLLPRGTLR